MSSPSQQSSPDEPNQRCLYDGRAGATIRKAAREIGLGKYTPVFIHPDNTSAAAEFGDSLARARRTTWIALAIYAAVVTTLAVLRVGSVSIYVATLLLLGVMGLFPAPSNDTVLMFGMLRSRRLVRWIAGMAAVVVLILIGAKTL